MSSMPRTQLQKRALRLEIATIAWNIGETVLTIGLGIVAASLALIGFGTDSIIEVFASSVVVWHLSPDHPADHPGRTSRALRLVAMALNRVDPVLDRADQLGPSCRARRCTHRSQASRP